MMRTTRAAGDFGLNCFKISATRALLASTTLCLAFSATARVKAGVAPAASPVADANSNEDIIVTAGKREQLLSKIAGGISVVTAKQLDDRAANSLSDYIALTPGVNLQTAGAPGFGSVEIRGVSPQSVGATVSTYVDEIPLSATSALTQGGEFLPDLDPSDLARVEVLKGPQGTLYGASSLGGVIKYVTKGPSLTDTEVNTSEDVNVLNNGQFGTKLRASLTTPLITDTLGIRISGFYRHDAGSIDQLGPVARNNANSGNDYGFKAAIRWKAAPNLTIDLNGSLDDYKSRGFAVADLDPTTLAPLYGIKDSNYRALNEDFHARTDLVSATVKWETGLGTVTSATSYSYEKPSSTNDATLFFANPPTQPQDPTAVVSYLNPAGDIGSHLDKKTTEELRLNSRRFGSIEFIVGGFYQHEDLRDGIAFFTYTPSGQPTDTSLGYTTRTGTLNEYAGFINATYYLTDKLDVTGGFRHSYIDQTRGLIRTPGYVYGDVLQTDYQKFSETSDTYLAGVRWRPTDEVTLYVRAASGYRPGGGRSVPPGAPADFGTTYSSDSIWSYEAGVKVRTRDGKFTIDADGFWIDWSNIQTLVYVGRFDTDGNGGKARSRGAEVSATYEPVRGLSLYANGALTDAKFSQDAPDIGVTNGQRLFFIPKWTGTFGGDYRWSLNSKWNGTVGGDYSYRSNQLDISNHKLPGYAMLTLHAGIDNGKYSVNVYVKNAANRHVIIGDEGYYSDLPPYNATFLQPRQIGVTFNQKF
jgi:outer membrane receptor protein involved in Fe transport